MQTLGLLNMAFDSLTRSVAKVVTKFFAQHSLREEVYQNDEELTKALITYFESTFFVQLQDLKIEAKRIEGGYSGIIKTTSLKSPLSFEIIPAD